MAMGTMGIGGLSNTISKRKFRWAFFVEGVVKSGYDPGSGHICKTATRPTFTFDQQEVQHVSEKVFLPGKPTWEPIEISMHDLSRESYMYSWLTRFYDPSTGEITPVAEAAKRTAQLALLDGHGNTIELWYIYGCWPASINWGDLDFSSSDLVDIKANLRYDRAVQTI